MRKLLTYKLFENNTTSDGVYCAELSKAIRREDMNKVDLFLPHILDLNTEERFGYTPLIIAATIHNISILKKIIAAGADVNYKNSFGKTALMETARYGDCESLQELIDAGADLDLRDNSKNETALFYAVYNEKIKNIKYLINAGSDLTIRNDYGQNILGYKLNWYTTEEAQRLILSKAPILFKSFIGLNIPILPEIQKEFKHIIFADETGLLN